MSYIILLNFIYKMDKNSLTYRFAVNILIGMSKSYIQKSRLKRAVWLEVSN